MEDDRREKMLARSVPTLDLRVEVKEAEGELLSLRSIDEVRTDCCAIDILRTETDASEGATGGVVVAVAAGRASARAGCVLVEAGPRAGPATSEPFFSM